MVIKKTIHENYNPRNFDNDIAILTLNETVTFTEAIAPICLPSKTVSGLDSISQSKFTGQQPFVAGWGSVKFRGPKSTQLLEVSLTVRKLPMNSQIICYIIFSAPLRFCPMKYAVTITRKSETLIYLTLNFAPTTSILSRMLVKEIQEDLWCYHLDLLGTKLAYKDSVGFKLDLCLLDIDALNQDFRVFTRELRNTLIGLNLLYRNQNLNLIPESNFLTNKLLSILVMLHSFDELIKILLILTLDILWMGTRPKLSTMSPIVQPSVPFQNF